MPMCTRGHDPLRQKDHLDPTSRVLEVRARESQALDAFQQATTDIAKAPDSKESDVPAIS